MKFNLQPTLEDDLVLLRPLEKEDIEPLYEIAKDPLIWEQHPSFDRYQRKVYELFFEESLNSKGAFVVIDKATNKIIGSSRFKAIEGTDNAIEIGWSFLARTYWGGKYNRAVKTLLMDYVFNFMEYVVYYVEKKNIRSQRAVMKLGGVRVSGSEYEYLMSKLKEDYTYIVGKK